MAGYQGRAIGIEHDADACATARAADHERILADVADLDPGNFGRCVTGLIMSPPCQAWSTAGNRGGEADRAAVADRMTAFARSRPPAPHRWVDPRSMLTAEPMRYVTVLRPRWIALEQVPPVLPLWQHTAALLRTLGYTAWVGILSAERYGVPQTRRRAILIARRDATPAGPPEPTHRAHGEPASSDGALALFGDELPPPVSMAAALGWGLPDRPAWTVTAGGTDTGGAEVFGNYRARQELARWAMRSVHRSRNADGDPDRHVVRDSDEPALTVTGNPNHWVLRSNYSDGGDNSTRTIREIDEPATTITGKPGHWAMRNGNQANSCERDMDEPAGTLFFGHRANAVEFIEHDGQGRRRVSVAEAGLLQGFPIDYPWHGTTSAKYRQIGDAVPPPLAAAILAPLIQSDSVREAA